MVIPVEILLLVNGALLFLAAIAATVLVRASVRYQRSLGDGREQQYYTRVIINAVLALILLALAAAGLNLFSL
jgi:hypothetical protein